MASTLHKVSDEELPVLKDWLQKYLPESRKIYFTLEETIQGRWRGISFYTLGWPDILAVAEGTVDADKNPGAPFLLNPTTRSAYSPSLDHLETLLTWPGLFDWSKPLAMSATAKRLCPVIEKIGKANGGNLLFVPNIYMVAEPGEIPALPVPKGFELRDLDPDLDTDYVVSTWPHRRRHTETYVRELIKVLPAVGLFETKSGQCIGVEISYEYGALGMLHVREEYRGRGFGKIITSALAQKHFQMGRSVAVWVITNNTSSVRMHEKVGFKVVDPRFFDFIQYYHGDLQEYRKQIGFHLNI